MNSKGFIFFPDYLEHLDLIKDDKQFRNLIKALCVYHSTGELPDNLEGIAKMAFSFIKSTIDRDNEKYENVCSRNKHNGSRGGRPKKPKEPSGFSENPNNPEEPKKANTKKNTNIKTNTKKNTNTISWKTDEQFLNFINWLPERPQKDCNKQKAYTEWLKIIKAKKYTADNLILSARQYQIHCKKTNCDFIYKPENFLKNGEFKVFLEINLEEVKTNERKTASERSNDHYNELMQGAFGDILSKNPNKNS